MFRRITQSWQYRDRMKPYFFRITIIPVPYRQLCTIQAFEQFGTLIILNTGDKYPYRSGFKPSRGPTSQFRAITGPNRPSVPARSATRHFFIMFKPILFFIINDHHYIYVHVKSQCSLSDHDCLLYRKIRCIQDSVKLQEDLHSLENWAAK